MLRSCAFAAAYLPRLGATLTEVQDILAVISCTGPRNEIGSMEFRGPVEKLIGCCIATADYLGQLAAPDYPGELRFFSTSFRSPMTSITFRPPRACSAPRRTWFSRTPGFWVHFVRPKLENDFQGMYRFLAEPYPLGPNPYITAIEQNIAEISARIQAVAQK